jgi:uncharacterized protein YukE
MGNKNSMAEQPDLDWSQVRETVRMINLAVAQVDMAMRQSDDSISALTSSFTSMVAHIEAISEAAGKIDGHSETVDAIQSSCKNVTDNMHHSIIAFQFYDKLSQRLDHVNHALTSLAELVADQSKLYNPQQWVELQEQIRSRYSMSEEQVMFDALLSGATIEEALDVCRDKVNHMTSSQEDIELF